MQVDVSQSRYHSNCILCSDVWRMQQSQQNSHFVYVNQMGIHLYWAMKAQTVDWLTLKAIRRGRPRILLTDVIDIVKSTVNDASHSTINLPWNARCKFPTRFHSTTRCPSVGRPMPCIISNWEKNLADLVYSYCQVFILFCRWQLGMKFLVEHVRIFTSKLTQYSQGLTEPR